MAGKQDSATQTGRLFLSQKGLSGLNRRRLRCSHVAAHGHHRDAAATGTTRVADRPWVRVLNGTAAGKLTGPGNLAWVTVSSDMIRVIQVCVTTYPRAQVASCQCRSKFDSDHRPWAVERLKLHLSIYTTECGIAI
jgi:hypothetical protein